MFILTTVIFECIFAANILINFLTEYVPNGENVPVRELPKIAERYLSRDFLMDFIPTFPITFFLDMDQHKIWRILFVLKIIRLVKGIKIYDVEVMMAYIKDINMKRVF
jgi:hypothetical protein